MLSGETLRSDLLVRKVDIRLKSSRNLLFYLPRFLKKIILLEENFTLSKFILKFSHGLVNLVHNAWRGINFCEYIKGSKMTRHVFQSKASNYVCYRFVTRALVFW